MGKFVEPSVYLVGYSAIHWPGLTQYLKDTGNEDFLQSIEEALKEGLNEGDVLTSFYAKLCYASLTEGKNDNLSKVRGIKANLIGTLESAHGSVFEHVVLNFVVTNCSRVYTHEQVRHRVGVAYSQTSGRYVRGDEIDLVSDPILNPVVTDLAELRSIIEERYNQMVQKMKLDKMKDFNLKKKITSALRRILPNGQSNEMGMSLNLRTLRHLIQLRTNRFSEKEIRLIFGQVYAIVKERHPLLFAGAKEQEVDGLIEVSGLKLQPYEKLLSDYSTDELIEEMTKRGA